MLIMFIMFLAVALPVLLAIYCLASDYAEHRERVSDLARMASSAAFRNDSLLTLTPRGWYDAEGNKFKGYPGDFGYNVHDDFAVKSKKGAA